MIGKEDPGEGAESGALADRCQALEKVLVVFLRAKDHLAVHSPDHDMVQRTGRIQPRIPRRATHPGRLGRLESTNILRKCAT